ncbi:uncharacterized protein [Onthophagus taurus]|uniref:uncharacterized protein n=3 Tax=Onthophagus taurus TaxID=166361 RepID=UPI0039BDE344
MVVCEDCGKSFTRVDNLKRHQRLSCIGKRIKLDAPQIPKAVKCEACDDYVNRQCYSAHLRSNAHKRNAFVIIDDGVERIAGAFGDKIVSYRISEEGFFVDLDEFSHRIREKILNLIQSAIDIHRNVKLNMECFGLYFLQSKEDCEIKSFNTKNKVVSLASDLYKIYKEFIDEISSKMSEFQERDSGWTLMQILYMELNLNKYNPIRASNYIDLPSQIKAKRAVINIQNADDACFAWAVTSALHEPNGLPQRTSSYPNYLDCGLDYSNIVFPVKLRDIPVFEKQNKLSINVYGINEYFKDGVMNYDIITMYICRQKEERHINLLLVTNDSGNSHYCWIKNLSRLLSSQASQNGHEKYICDGCLVFFTSENKLIRHQSDDCSKVRAILPTTNLKINKYGNEEKENILQFENFERQLKIPFVVYADFEALQKPIADAEATELNDDNSYSVKCFKHEPYAFAYYIKCSYDESLSKFEIYCGCNAAQIFMSKLEHDVLNIYKNYLSQPKEMLPLPPIDRLIHEMQDICHICSHKIKEGNKVCDHDHLTGLYRGPAHAVCNINYQLPKFIPIFFHNLSNYDCHMFVKDMALKEEDVDVIAQNKEKYISFSKKIIVGENIDSKGKLRRVHMKLRFVDSFRFMALSLEKLGSFLEDNQCVQIRKYFRNEEQFRLIRQKGVFPYSFVDSFEKLNLTALPDRSSFYNTLCDDSITEENYCRAQTVWNLFNCRTLGEYSDIYLTSDVLLLADVFENFRTISMKYYSLDPCHYFTAPGFGWDALLRMTGVKLELLTDIDMLHFFKNGIRGGLSMCTKRSAKANNKLMMEFDETKDPSYILYLDATNLYGHAMRRKLPTGGFRWLSDEEIQKLDIYNTEDDSEKGYVFEVDLEYPEAIHDEHNDLPFCPERIVPPGSKNAKLIANLENKTKYIIHYVNLKQCIKFGLKLTKIYRVLEFKQSNWMRSYIDFNSDKRAKAKNEFEKNHYKAMNNIVYGKTMENVEKRVDIRLVTHWECRHKKPGVEALIAKPNFKSSKIFCDNLIAVQLNVAEVRYCKPLYVGFSILELSKTVMYSFFYDYLKVKYGNNITLLYTDTDSLILEITTPNVYEDIKENIEFFDTSNYPLENIHNIPRGRSVLGRMKDEYPNRCITSFVGTGAKAYCITLLNDNVKKAKGVKKYVIDKHLSVTDYKRVVECGGSVHKKMYIFKSEFHTMYTELKNKIALSSCDDKRYILPNGCNTLAWGHWLIKRLNANK